FAVERPRRRPAPPAGHAVPAGRGRPAGRGCCGGRVHGAAAVRRRRAVLAGRGGAPRPDGAGSAAVALRPGRTGVAGRRAGFYVGAMSRAPPPALAVLALFGTGSAREPTAVFTTLPRPEYTPEPSGGPFAVAEVGLLFPSVHQSLVATAVGPGLIVPQVRLP